MSDPNSDAFQMYQNVEEKCRKYTKRIAIFLLMDQMMTIASIFYSFYCIAVGNSDTSTWLLPFQFAVPFNPSIIWKWYILWIYNLLANLAYAGIITSVSSYFVCCCLYIQGICHHFDLLIDSIQNDVQQNQIETTAIRYRQRSRQIWMKCCKLIDIHVNAVQ